MSLVVDLAQTTPAPTLGQVGGKARNLAVLLSAGLPVPPAWCVTTAAYHQITDGRLDDVLGDLADAAAQDRARLSTLAARARALVESAAVPAELEKEIARVLALAGGPVAVRSSATAEDLPDASFAGQQDSFLQVVGTANVLAAVRSCWASLWSDRAVAYRADQGIDPRSVALAVVVQRMVAAEVAGVQFTADPVSGTRHRCVIEASPGLGESVVSGLVDPDRFVVDTASGTVIERRLGARTLAVRPRPSGGTDRVDLRPSDVPCLDDDTVRSLAGLGRVVEDLYGAPQDVEWALDASGLWVLQARPITTLYPLVQRPDRTGKRIFLCVSLAQGLTRPLTPLALSAFQLIGSSLALALGRPPDDPSAGPGALRVAGGRPFIDVTAALQHPIGRPFLLAVMGVMEARSAAVLRSLVSRGEFPVQPAGRLTVVVPVLRLVRLTRAPIRVVTALIDPTAAGRAAERIERDIRRRLSLPAAASPQQRLELVVQHLSTRSFLVMPSMAPFAGAGFLALALARRLLRQDLRPGELHQVLRGLPHNPTTEMDLALWAVTERVRADPLSRRRFAECTDDQLAAAYLARALPPVLMRELAEFLRRYGHRTVAEIDLGMPRWRDDPTPLFGALRNYLRLPDDAPSPADQFTAGARRATAVQNDLVARARQRGRVRGRLVDLALRRARSLAGLREMPKFLLVLTLAELRTHLTVVADHLVQRGLLKQPDDLAFCTLGALRRGLAGQDLRSEVETARRAYERELRRRHVPRLLLSDGTEPETLLPAPEGALTGTPASTGVVTARARVVLDPRGAHLEPGEVLVAPSTDPGWTPLFLTAGALVMEMGGANSHGAVVAREYGIPAVVGVAAATTRLSTGDLITVDGGAGTIVAEPLSEPASDHSPARRAG